MSRNYERTAVYGSHPRGGAHSSMNKTAMRRAPESRSAAAILLTKTETGARFSRLFSNVKGRAGLINRFPPSLLRGPRPTAISGEAAHQGCAKLSNGTELCDDLVIFSILSPSRRCSTRASRRLTRETSIVMLSLFWGCMSLRQRPERIPPEEESRPPWHEQRNDGSPLAFSTPEVFAG